MTTRFHVLDHDWIDVGDVSRERQISHKQFTIVLVLAEIKLQSTVEHVGFE